MKNTGTVAQAIAAYLGVNTNAIKTLECHPDPMVAGTYAFRATVEKFPGVSLMDWDGTNHSKPTLETYGFLTIGVPLQRLTADDLEECEWETWPPKSEGHVTGWVVR
jgi:hypothetical protein